MTCYVKGGPVKWSCTRDGDGNRTYKVEFLVVSNDPKDGPATVLQTPGLAQPGDFWVIDNDVDLWATCRLDAAVTPVLTAETNKHWKVEQTFSTKDDSKKCKDQQIEDPLLQPQKVSGDFAKHSEEATLDRFLRPILTSSHEVIRGKQVEFDNHTPNVEIEQNVAALQAELWTPMIDTLNDAPLWGFPARCWKLGEPKWEKKFYGSCYFYYTRKLKFEANARLAQDGSGRIESGWDRDLLDEGSKALHGHWDPVTGVYTLDNINGLPPNPNNPQHFDRFKDRNGENTKVILDGLGAPAATAVSLSGFFVSRLGPNIDNLLTDPGRWDPATNPKTPTVWDALTEYRTGNVVTHSGESHVALRPSLNIAPPNAAFWDSFTALQDKGSYDPAVTYQAGDYVEDSAATASPGYVHVEKYGESNFLVLGIPLVL